MTISEGKVLREIIGFVCFLALTFGFLFQANADQSAFAGSWQQIASNAGLCEKCRLTIEQQGAVVRVTANNGWFAVVETEGDGKSQTVRGIGRWKHGHGGSYSSAPFNIQLTLTDGQLYMNMTVPMANRPTRVIRAVFDRLPSSNRNNGSSIKA